MRGVLVVGVHSGGTSALTGALVALGLGRPADPEPLGQYHPRGQFESRSMCQFNDALLARLGSGWPVGMPGVATLSEGWAGDSQISQLYEPGSETLRGSFPTEPWAFKDPRLCVLLPFWRAVVDDEAVGLLIIRHPVEVARSLARRNGFGLGEALSMWEHQMRSAVRDLSGITVMATTYDSASADPLGWCEAAAAWLTSFGIGVAHDRAGEACGLLDEELRHQTVGPADSDLLSRERQALYAARVKACGSHEPWGRWSAA